MKNKRIRNYEPEEFCNYIGNLFDSINFRVGLYSSLLFHIKRNIIKIRKGLFIFIAKNFT